MWVNRRRIIASRAKERASFSEKNQPSSINDKSALLDDNLTTQFLVSSENEPQEKTREQTEKERQRENSVNQEESNVNLKLNFETFKSTYKKIGFLSFNLFLVS
jgi:hypothetical protein